MNGKQKCRLLKEIRRQIAEANDIGLVIAECTHKGDCRGTCPRCEAEVRYLERELEKRRGLQKRVALAGVAAGVTMALSGCAVVDQVMDVLGHRSALTGDVPARPGVEELDGEVAPDDIETLDGEVAPDDIETLDGEVAPEDIGELEGEYTPDDMELLEGDVPMLPETDEWTTTGMVAPQDMAGEAR